MKINIKDNALRLDIDRRLKALPQNIDRALAITAQQGVNIILDRTERGKGINSVFTPYTEKYAKFRQQRGRKIFPVDLNFTGRMLGSMTTERVRSGVQRIKFSRAEESRKAYFNNQKRPFFGFSQSEKAILAKFFRSKLVV
jgi:hypothetical protein